LRGENRRRSRAFAQFSVCFAAENPPTQAKPACVGHPQTMDIPSSHPDSSDIWIEAEY
jgi:hypothetical protein